ncbi:MAG: diguanylate cyclase [Chloroflexaceae bacterium]
MQTFTPRPDEATRRSHWFQRLRIGTIRIRLLAAFVALVVFPALIISITTTSLGFRHGKQQVTNQLQSVATLKEEQIEAWLESLQIYLTSVLYPHQVPHLIEPLLSSDPESAAYKQAAANLRIQFEQVLMATDLFEEVLLLDRQGRVVLSTDPANEGQVHLQDYFRRGLQEPYTQSLSSDTAQGLSSPVVVSRPVIDLEGTVRGVLVGRSSSERLNEIMLQRAGLGETGETYLVGQNALLLTDSRFEDRDKKILRLQSPALETVFSTQTDRSGLYTSYRGLEVIGVYHWLPSLQMVLVAEQEKDEAFQSTYALLRVNAIVAVVAALIALLFGLFIARGIAMPLAGLAATATRIAAGDLNLRAHVERDDEVGAVADAFNRMTARLRQVIGNLEQHVQELQQAELEVRRVNAHLERDVSEQEALNRLSNMLQRCQTLDEAYRESVHLLRELFAGRAGALYRRLPDAVSLSVVGQWGNDMPIQVLPPEGDCPILQGEHYMLTDACDLASRCRTGVYSGRQSLICVQLQTGGEQFGLLQVRAGAADAETLQSHLLPLVVRTADLLALALANLHLRENLREQAIRDPLTGLFNRRFLNETLIQTLSHARRYQRSMAIYLLDLDHFKYINDTYGHDAGDAVLRAVGSLLRTGLRSGDTACRFGGEELLVVLPEITEEDAIIRADMLRQAISALDIEHGNSLLPAVTVSIGVAVFPDHGSTHDALLTAADRALYRAKAAGRNRVCVAELAQAEVY